MNSPAKTLVEHFFRRESANLTAALTRAFGVRRIDLIEDMVQVAMVEAMQCWSRNGVPDNPAAWLHRVAKNRVFDALRRERSYTRALTLVGATEEAQDAAVDQWLADEHLPDSLLRMCFVCCHPTLRRQTQIALTLKTLCGFGVHEIARGLMLSVDNVKKRIQRARRSLAAANVGTDLPGEAELAQRLDVVHDVLYLMFNEGYSTSRGVEPIRNDICEEAARLTHLLCESSLANSTTKALLALLLFHSARLEARVDGEGAAVLLEDQERSLWDQRLVVHGLHWLEESKTNAPSTLHYEAAIAMKHSVAASVRETDWPRIVTYYDKLLQLKPSPVYRLNRAIAIGETGEINDALELLLELRQQSELATYPLLDCALARVHEVRGERRQAADCYAAALEKTSADHERRLIKKKLGRL